MTDEYARSLDLSAGSRFQVRLRRLIGGVTHRHNQRQLGRFLVVGASGYVVNTATFAIVLHGFKTDYKLAFVIAFLVGAVNNFFWNRHWTFKAHEEHPAKQGLRFLLVSAIVAVLAYGIMVGLVALFDIWKVPADAIAWILVTPASFLIQKLWSFKA